MASVLVTDGEQRSALAIVRSLGRAGHRVLVCSPRRRSLAGASRHCAAHVVAPDPLGEPGAFADAVAKIVAREGVEVLLPVSEAAMLALLPHRERFGGARIPFPQLDAFRRICDKAAVAEAAAGLGIGVPAQHVVRAPADADPRTLRYPLVVKPARSVSEGEAGRSKASVVHVAGPAALEAALRALPASAFPVLLQERVVGPGVGVFLLMRGGQALAAFAHRRIREKPPSGGVSVLRESAPLEPELLERSCALLRAFGWEGPAMVEYKVDAATGTPYIMEINGRFWGSLQLAIDAGVDFPALLLAEEAPAGFPAYRTGVRSRWEWGDVDHLIARLRRTPEELALPPGSPGRGRAVLDFVASFGGGTRAEVFRLADPLPFVRETLDWVRRR